jgi:anti-sigma B factor antagonist
MPQASVVTSSTAAGLRAAPPQCVCSWEAGGSDAAWVHVAGELDHASTPKLSQTVRDARLYARLVVLDLREVTFMESSAVHVILDAAGDAQETGGRLILVRGPAHVDRALTLTGACEEVEIFDLAPSEPPAQVLLQLAQRGAHGQRGERGRSQWPLLPSWSCRRTSG